MKTCIITDGGDRVGMGHVQQALALAGRLSSIGEVSFLTQSDTIVTDKITAGGFSVQRLGGDPGILDSLKELSPDLIIFDKIDVSEDLARQIRQEIRSGLVLFTNLTDANRHAHLVVIAGVRSNFMNVRRLDPATGTVYLYGPRYWVLRDEFLRYRSSSRVAPHEVRRLLLAFGGSDPENVCCAVLDVLLSSELSCEIEVLLGAHYGHDEALAAVLSKHRRRCREVRLQRDVANVAEHMVAADVALVSPGLSAFEALRVGTPIIVIPQNRLGTDTYRGRMQMVEKREAQRLPALIADRDFTFATDPAVVGMQIGEGLDEILSEMRRLAAVT